MGLARLNLIAQASNDLTASGVTLGTFDYISPEQARDPRSADVRSDLYSLGCSFYYMLTGRPPFPEGTVLQKLLQHQADVPPDPRTVRPELPSQVTRILGGLLAKNPSERYQQPAELLEELSTLGHSLGLQLGEAQPTRIPPKPLVVPARWRAHVPWIVPLAALFLIVFALDLYWSGGTRATTSLDPSLNSKRPATETRSLIPPKIDVPPVTPPQIEPGEQSPATGVTPPSPTEISPELNPKDTALDAAPETMPPDNPESPAVKPTSEGLGKLLNQIGGIDFFEQWKRETELRAAKAKESSPMPPSDELDLSSDDTSPMPPMPAVAPVPSGTLLTVGDESAPDNYTSLLAACSAAEDGDTIELRYNGRRTERPLTLSNVKLTIQAGTGYRPIVVFAPEPDKPFLTKQMVSVSGGQLSARNVHWEFDLPAGVQDGRALFESQHCDLLDFQNCTFTVRGRPPYYAGVSFFDIRAIPGSGTMGMGVGSMDAHIVNIHLSNCVARGEATLLHDADLQSVRLTWNDGLLATSERLIVTEGNSVQPPREPRAEVVLRHVTVVTGNGLVLMTNSQEEPHQMVVDLRCQDCILATTGSAAAVEQRGSAGIEEFSSRFVWSGDNDYFAGFSTFWQIMNSAGLTGSKQFSFQEWKDHWRFNSLEQFAGSEAVTWATPPTSGRPYHTHLPSDYVLSASAAIAGASDGSNAGAPLPYLPLPSEKSAVSSSVRGQTTPDPAKPLDD
jgi:eukaryotic-like serine/threonine-protein kinase